MRGFLLIICGVLTYSVIAQEINHSNDSIQALPQLALITKKNSPERLPDIQNQVLFAGKKNEVIRLSSINANAAVGNAREVFSRIPGVHIWENEGSGIQINVGLRGLSPNRSWELNTRQNGYDISSDVFGYPEAYYNPPLEAVDKIELVRGGASLQFGPQFGGTINYVLKREREKKISFESLNTTGSYGLFNSFNALGGSHHKFTYYAYHQFRRADGWRHNSYYDLTNTHGFFEWKFSAATQLSVEYTRMDYKMQQAGGLTDSQFAENPQQSLRARNWFGTPWNLFSLNFNTRFTNKLTSNTKFFGLIGERNSVGVTATPQILDEPEPISNNYSNRRVDRDFYQNIGLENRNLLDYNLFGKNQHLSFGFRLYRAQTIRQQEGKGTAGFDFDLTTLGDYSRDLNYETRNAAFFAENLLQLTEQFSMTTGVRYEHINSIGYGRLGIASGTAIAFNEQEISRNRLLFGIGLEYALKTAEIYGNLTQAYRPILFSDLTPPAVTDVIDNNLTDAEGFNADFGLRGNIKKWLNFDVSIFYLSYNNRIGNISAFINNDPAQGTYLFRTNVGSTVNKGIESFINVNFFKLTELRDTYGDLDAFFSVSFIDSRYTDFRTTTVSGSPPNSVISESNLQGNRVENTPRYIHNFGLSWSKKGFSATLQQRMSGRIYTDANNTKEASANGITGMLEAFQVSDFALEYQINEQYCIKGGCNNLFDEVYATRRASGYPGPGILPGEGRTFYISFGLKI